MTIVGIEHRNAAGRQAFEDFAFGPRYRLDAAEIFDMRAACVVDQRHVGARELRQAADFTRMIHPQFDHCIAVFGAQFQQRERHADFVIEIAACGEHCAIVVDALA